MSYRINSQSVHIHGYYIFTPYTSRFTSMAFANNSNLHYALSSTPSSIFSVKGADLMVLKVASVLSTSYSDNDFRDAILLADQRSVGSSAKTRRLLRLDLLGEAISCNGELVKEMGTVVEVR